MTKRQQAGVRGAAPLLFALALPFAGCQDDTLDPPPVPDPNATLNCPTGLHQVGGKCVDVDECADGTHTCGPTGQCTNTHKRFTCECELNWHWDAVAWACIPEPCEAGYERLGPDCTDIDECAPADNPCVLGGAACFNSPGAYECQCPPGGTWVTDHCAYPPCPDGFQRVGPDCVDVDECAAGSPCPADAACINSEGGYTCDCGAGRYHDGAACAAIPCPDGMTRAGAACVDVDECLAQGAACSDGGASCANSDPGWACVCDPGFAWGGAQCEAAACPHGFIREGALCVDIDDCGGGVDPCADGGGICENTNGGYGCLCAGGMVWTGTACSDAGCPLGYADDGAGGCADVDECANATSPCPDGVECVDTEGSFTCACPAGTAWDGAECFAGDGCAALVCSAACFVGDGGAMCTSSVADKASPFWGDTCTQPAFLAAPTALDADCRCGDNRAAIAACAGGAAAGNVGKGPSALVAKGTLTGGFFAAATGEVIAGVTFGESLQAAPGFVLAVSALTGDRRVVTGTYPSPDGSLEVGSGYPLEGGVYDVQPGPDGAWYAHVQADYAWQMEIVRVDAATGARTLVWKGGDPAFGQCAPGDVGLSGATGAATTREGFAVGPDGRFFLSFDSPLRDGRGVVAVAPDGSACAYLTIAGERLDGLTAGSGIELVGRLRGLAVHQGGVYGVDVGSRALVRVDVTTGARTLVAPFVLGDRWVRWDAARQVFWTSGAAGKTLAGSLDPATGALTPLVAYGPLLGCCQDLGGLWIDPAGAGRLYLAFDKTSVVEVEPATGNALTLSR